MEKSNTYIFIYSVVLVVIIATMLSVTAYVLKPAQQANVKIEKMQNILTTVGIETDVVNAEERFKKELNDFFYVDAKGNKIPADSTIDILDSKNLSDKEKFPIYDVNDYYVIPLNGAGLWGAIWGYISISKADCNTIKGVVFDHASETAGLGAEIVKEKFRGQFEGKHIFQNDGEFTSVKVIKGGAKNQYNEVDAISGSTKTCEGVNAMLHDCLNSYVNYFGKFIK